MCVKHVGMFFGGGDSVVVRDYGLVCVTCISVDDGNEKLFPFSLLFL